MKSSIEETNEPYESGTLADRDEEETKTQDPNKVETPIATLPATPPATKTSTMQKRRRGTVNKSHDPEDLNEVETPIAPPLRSVKKLTILSLDPNRNQVAAIRKQRWGAVRSDSRPTTVATPTPKSSQPDNEDCIDDDIIKEPLAEDKNLRRGSKWQRLEDVQDCGVSTQEAPASSSGDGNLSLGVGAGSNPAGRGNPLSVSDIFQPPALRPRDLNYQLTPFQMFDQHSYRVWTHDYRPTLKGYHNNNIEYPYPLFDCSAITFTIDDESFRQEREEYLIDLFFQKRYYVASSDKARSVKSTPDQLLASWNDFVRNISDPNMMWMKYLKTAKDKFLKHSFLGLMIKTHLACLDEHIECRVKSEYKCPMCYEARQFVRISDQREPSTKVKLLRFLLNDRWAHRSEHDNQNDAQQEEDAEFDNMDIVNLQMMNGQLLYKNASLERRVKDIQKSVRALEEQALKHSNAITVLKLKKN